MMTCTQVREQLPALLDDRLATAAVRDLRAHLAGCPGCERELATLSHTLRALDAMPVPSPTPQLRARVYAAIAADPVRVGNVRDAGQFYSFGLIQAAYFERRQ